MPCYSPLTAFKSLTKKTKNDKHLITFKESEAGIPFETLKLPCGVCIGCRIRRSKDWAIRCCHEAELYTFNCFITLTFNDEHINETGTLVKSDFQKFMKRLRKMCQGIDAVAVDDKITYPIRYFHCGEYGAELLRPHHHACLFNFDFLDKVYWTTRNGTKLYRSPTLEKLWPYGYSTIGEVNFESAAYISRYVTKKKYGEQALDHYTVYDQVDKSTGEVPQLEPEYITMSRRPGIAKRWIEKHAETDVYNKDYFHIGKKKLRPPKYYDDIYDSINPDNLESIKEDRKEYHEQQEQINDKRRTEIETAKMAQHNNFGNRSFEGNSTKYVRRIKKIKNDFFRQLNLSKKGLDKKRENFYNVS